MLKKLGVIGGMGPEATSFYYARVIARTKAESDQEHINMIILSHATMPDRTQAILTGNKLPFLKAITQDARDLEMLGVENIAIPCNTSHYFLEDIQKSTPVVPGEACQKDVMSLIYDDIKKGKPGDKNKFDRAYNDLKAKGCDAVILACTEISVFKEYYQVPADCMDAMDVLVRESIIRSGAEYRE